MKYDIPHFDYMDEYMLSIIKMMDTYMHIVKNNVKEDDWMMICKIQ
jgi:hypothetical protein